MAKATLKLSEKHLLEGLGFKPFKPCLFSRLSPTLTESIVYVPDSGIWMYGASITVFVPPHIHKVFDNFQELLDYLQEVDNEISKSDC